MSLMALYLFAKPTFHAQLCIYSVLLPSKSGLFPTFSACPKLFELFTQFDMVQSISIASACDELSGSLAQFDSNNLRTSEAVKAIVAPPAVAPPASFQPYSLFCIAIKPTACFVSISRFVRQFSRKPRNFL